MDAREAVARAICLQTIRENGDPDAVDPFGWSEYLPQADAAIAAHLKALAAEGYVVVPMKFVVHVEDFCSDAWLSREASAIIQAVDNG